MRQTGRGREMRLAAPADPGGSSEERATQQHKRFHGGQPV